MHFTNSWKVFKTNISDSPQIMNVGGDSSDYLISRILPEKLGGISENSILISSLLKIPQNV